MTKTFSVVAFTMKYSTTSDYKCFVGAQWLSGRVLDSRPKGCGFEPHRRHCVVSLSKNINPSLVLVQPRKTRPLITERLLMGHKESNQTNKQTNALLSFLCVYTGCITCIMGVEVNIQIFERRQQF